MQLSAAIQINPLPRNPLPRNLLIGLIGACVPA